MKLYLIGLFTILFSTTMFNATAAECQCEYTDKNSLEVGAQQIVDNFLGRARDVSQTKLDGVSVKIENTPGLIFISFDRRTIFVPWWPELDTQIQSMFLQIAGDPQKGLRMFQLLFQQFFISHEAAHWLQFSAKGAKGGTEFMQGIDHYHNEFEANQLAVAYWMETAGGEDYLTEIEDLLKPILAQLPNPVPVGTTPAEYFNSNYERLGEDPMAYGWFQFRFVLDALVQRQQLDFEKLVKAIPALNTAVVSSK